MKKENIKTTLNIVSPMASAGSLLLPPLVIVPIIASVYNEVCSYWESKSIKDRIQSLQEEVDKQGIPNDDFAQHISELGEHGQYVLRNNLKHLCLAAQPETTDMLNKAIIECVMSESFGMAEHACEILQQCNSDDILLLQLIKNFQINKSKHNYHKKKTEALANENTSGFQDSVILFDEDTTILWEDFIESLHIKTPDHGLEAFLSIPSQRKDPNDKTLEEEIIYLAQLAKSIIKLQNLSVLQCKYHTTPGTISPGSIQCFHVTLFGKKLLEYIELDEQNS